MNYIKNIINQFVGINVDYDTKSKIEDCVSEYVQKLHYKLKQTKSIVFRNEPVDFNENYIPLTLVGNKINIRVTEIDNLFEKFSKIGVIGSAGSGKTTLLRHIALKCIEQNYRIPVFIELRNYNDVKGSFENYIASQISSLYSAEIKLLFKSNKFVFIFDGYDEIDYTEGSRFIGQIDELISKYSTSPFIISSRPGTNIESISPLYIFQIKPLNKDDIYLFIEKLNIQSNLKRNIFRSIEQEVEMDEILNIPLFLSLYIQTYRSSNESLNQKSIFFRNLIDSLFAHHDSVSKLGYVREKLSNLDKDSLEKVASTLAFRMLFSKRLQLTKDELFNELELIKKNGLYVFENDKLLFDLTITANILISAESYYTFPHVLILEYLSSIFIARLENSSKQELYQRMTKNTSIYLSVTFFEFLFETDYKSFAKYYLLPNLKQLVELWNYSSSPDFYSKTETLKEFIRIKIAKNIRSQEVSRFEIESFCNHLELDINRDPDSISNPLFDII